MEKDYSHLITGYLQGTLSKEDTDDFYDWIYDNPVHKKLFFETKAIYDACLTTNQHIDINKSWEHLLKKKHRTKRIILWKQAGSYAATILLAVSITSLFFMLVPDKTQTIASRYIGGDGLEANVVVLADGTQVSLGSNTTFYYESDYGRTQRKIFLEGEAYFEVAPNKKSPFIVDVNGQEIEALGTKFNVMGYPKDSIYTTTLLEGSIRISGDGLPQSIVLTPNQQFIFNRNSLVAKVHQVDAWKFTSWTSGYYYFPEQRLESILYRLGHVYGIEFTVHSEKLNNTVFTGTFYRGQNIQDIMEIIHLSVPIKYTIDDHHVSIYE